MTWKRNYRNYIILRTSLILFLTIVIIVLIIFKLYMLAIFSILLLLINIFSFYRKQQLIIKEFEQFVEGVKYHDFSQHFNVTGKGIGFAEFKEGFNTINKEFLSIGKEREKQHQYLQKIMDLVDTGILLYDMESGEVRWMNDAFRNIIGIPFFKNIEALHWKYNQLLQSIKDLSGKQKLVITINKEKLQVRLQISCSIFQVETSRMKLIVLQNINEVVDLTESQAWHKLLRVLTHEIMNSIAPISSLANTLSINIENQEDIHSTNKDDLLVGMQTIKNRSEGLLRFAEAYRNLNKIEKPQLSRFFIRDIFESLDILFEPTLEKFNIDLEIILKDTNLKVTADRSLLDQVFINLLLNAIDAVKLSQSACIQLYAEKMNDQVVQLKVLDNGQGMSTEIQERIFIPFFSTKSSGSGIGLSLCKQIILLHGGTLDVHSILEKGTAFTIELPEAVIIEKV